jgi:hypothetical protein
MLFAGCLFFLAFLVMFLLIAPPNEESLVTRAIVFVGLILPPVCFAAGICSGVATKADQDRVGAWANFAAIFAHGIAAIVILQIFFA